MSATRTMPRDALLHLIETLLSQPTGSLKGPEPLKGLKAWDSIGVMEFLVMCDSHFDRVPEADAIAACKSVDELIALLGDQVTASGPA